MLATRGLVWLACLAGVPSQAADPLDAWNLVDPRNGVNGINRLAWGVDRWLAVGPEGLLTSTNGLEWQGVSLSRDYQVNVVSHANGRWVAVGSGFSQATCDRPVASAAVVYSADGLNWSLDRLQPQGIVLERPLTDVAWGADRWIAVGGENGRGATSPDGVNWAPLVLGSGLSSNLFIYTVGYGNGNWVAAGEEASNAAWFRSTNGLNWTRLAAEPGSIRRVAWANGQWVAVGGSKIWNSTNAVDWTLRYNPAVPSHQLTSVSYGNARWTVAGANPPSDGVVLTSTNGINWTVLRQDSSVLYSDVAFATNSWLLAGRSASVVGNSFPSTWLTSTDGVAWVNRSLIGSNDFFSLKFGSNRWVAVGNTIYPSQDSAAIVTSTNGQQWTKITPALGGSFGTLRNVAFGSNQWVALGFYFDAEFNALPVTLSSTNGLTWNVKPGEINYASCLAYGGGKWLASLGTQIYTTDPASLTWVGYALPTGYVVNDLYYRSGLWVAVGYLDNPAGNDPPLILTSSNGTNWTFRANSIAAGSLSGVMYGRDRWVAVGSERITAAACSNNSTALVLTSSDAINWTRRDSGLPSGTAPFSKSALDQVTWTGDDWVAIGSYDRMTNRILLLASVDGIAWKMLPAIPGQPSYTKALAAAGNNRLVAANGNQLLVTEALWPQIPQLGIDQTNSQVWLLLSGKAGRSYDLEITTSPGSGWTLDQSVALTQATQRILMPTTTSNAFWRAGTR